jgi:aspartokinase
VSLVETIAVYWEENIRTYGIQVEKDLCLVQADVLPTRMVALGQQLAELGQGETKTRLILAHHFDPGVLRISMLFEEKWKEQLVEFCGSKAVEEGCGPFGIDSPVEMLYFHGPHYGDRYGIAGMAGHALKNKNIRYIAMGCSAASVHYIFPENQADKAKKALGSVFKTP